MFNFAAILMKSIYHIFIIMISFASSIVGQSFESVTYFMVDGLSQERFTELLNSGELPNVQSLIDHGIYVKQGIVSFPSMTGYCFYPFLTGVDASQSGILGLRWMDRSKTDAHFRNYVGRTNVHMNEDLRSDVKTIFEYFDRDEDYTATINSYCNRGVKESVKTGFAHVTSKYNTDNAFGKLEKIPFIGRKLFKDIYEFEEKVKDKALVQLAKNPKVHWITFASPDARNHVHGTDEVYDQLVINIDQIIGEYVALADQLDQNRLFAFVSDHGVRDVEYNIRVEESLLSMTGINLHRGKAANMFSMSLDEAADTYSDYHGKFVVNGNLSAFIYLIDQDQWTTRFDESKLRHFRNVDLIEALLEIEGIGLLIYRGDSQTFIVESKGGRGVIRSKGDSLSYSIEGKDPLRYEDFVIRDTFSYEQYYNADLFLDITTNSEYPDALNRIVGILHQTNSPDIVVLSEDGYDLAKDYEAFVNNYKGGHGGLHKDLISVPFILSGKGIQSKEIDVMRSEDFGKMIFDFLGLDIIK